MIERIKEENVWDFLKKDGKPVMIYGMGNGAEKIISTLNTYQITVSEIFASDEFVRGHSFLGYKVLKYSEVCEKYDDFNVVLAFATHLENVIENIKKINSEHKVFAPDVPVAGGGLFTREYVKEHNDDFDFVYEHLADEKSKKDYIDILNFKVSGKVDYLLNSFCDKESIYRNILKLNDSESIVDLGAYDGDTIREFTAYTKGKYNKIIALEPDAKSYKKLIKNTAEMKNLETYNMGAWNEKDTLIFAKEQSRNSHISASGVPVKVTDIDSLIDCPVTMIKMDIEGSEMKALGGAKRIIKTYLPKLYVCAYHRNEDLFALGKKILSLNDKYKLYFRHSVYILRGKATFMP